MMNEEDIIRELEEDPNLNVIDEVDLGDLSDVKAEKNLIPPVDDVKLKIRKVTGASNADDTYKSLNISVALEDGVQIMGETKFKGSVLFHRICYYASPEKYTKDWFKKKQHLVELTSLLKALGYDVSSTKVNQQLLKDMEGKSFIANIRQKDNSFTAKDGTEVKETINYITRIKALPADSQV